MKGIYDIVLHISLIISIVPLSILIYRWKKVPKYLSGLLLLLLSLELTTEISCKILSVLGIYNYPIIHAYTVLNSFILFLLYSKLIRSQKLVIFNIVLVFSIIISGVIEITIAPFAPNVITSILQGLLGVVLATSFFSQMINDPRIANLRLYPLFYMNSAVLFYFGTTICLRLFEFYIHFYSPEMKYFIWPFQLIANIIYHLILARSIWLMKRT